MLLTPHFSLEELTITNNSSLQQLNRESAQQYIHPLTQLCNLLEHLRNTAGPLQITSGFRCPELNSATPGSSNKSQHMKGEAADFCRPKLHSKEEISQLFDDCRNILKQSNYIFGQLILEEKQRADGSISCWVHISLGPPFREIGKSGQVWEMQQLFGGEPSYTFIEYINCNWQASY